MQITPPRRLRREVPRISVVPDGDWLLLPRLRHRRASCPVSVPTLTLVLVRVRSVRWAARKSRRGVANGTEKNARVRHRRKSGWWARPTSRTHSITRLSLFPIPRVMNFLASMAPSASRARKSLPFAAQRQQQGSNGAQSPGWLFLLGPRLSLRPQSRSLQAAGLRVSGIQDKTPIATAAPSKKPSQQHERTTVAVIGRSQR